MYTKKTTLWCKIETTSGTDSTPNATTNAVMAFNVSLDVKADMKERGTGNSDRSLYANIRGKTSVELKFDVELKGSGTLNIAPRWAPLLRACDRLETINAGTNLVYSMALVSETCTIWVDIDGITHKLAGCAGDCEIALVSGEVPMLKFTMSGIYVLPTDIPVTTPTYDSTVPVIVKATTVTFATYAAIIEKISLKFGNKVVERTSMNAAEGILSYMVTDRSPSGVLTCEAVLRAMTNSDYWSYFDAGTTKAIASLVIGTAAYNIITIAAPACKLAAPKYGDRDGLRTFDLDFAMCRSSGNDEMTITLT